MTENIHRHLEQDIKMIVLTHRLDINEGLASLEAAGSENSLPVFVRRCWKQDWQQL